MTNLRTALLATAVPVIASVLLALAASPAGAHPHERCPVGWTEVDGVSIDGSPEHPRNICYNEHHPYAWRNVIIGAATMAVLYPLPYALIMTPEAPWQEKATRRGRWRLIVRPRQLYRALPRRHWPAFWCSFPPAYLAGYVAAPPLLEWAFPPLSTAAVAVYVAVWALVAVAGSCIWVRKRRKGELAASQQPACSAFPTLNPRATSPVTGAASHACTMAPRRCSNDLRDRSLWTHNGGKSPFTDTAMTVSD